MKSVAEEYINIAILVLKRPVPNFSIGEGDGMTPIVPMTIIGKRQSIRFQAAPKKRRSLVALAPLAVVTKKEALRTVMFQMMKNGTEAMRMRKILLMMGFQKICGWMARRTRWVRTRLMANITATL